jgi:hypothetical protein
MTDLDRPLTRREFLEFRTNLDARLASVRSEMQEGLASVRSEMQGGLASVRSEMQAEFGDVRHEMAQGFVEMRRYVEAAIGSSEQRLRTHFDVVAESFRTEFRNLYDWAHSTTSGVAARVEILETNHGAQLEALDFRVTRLETGPQPGKHRSSKRR